MVYSRQGVDTLAATPKRTHKHFQLDPVKIKRAQKALRAKTETETIDRALDFAIAEQQKNRLAIESIDRFLTSGIEIQDVYGVLD
jgi:tyrosine-protein phosphatase YwqE